MADLSEVEAAQRSPIGIEVPGHWADHHFQGRSVLPAVEAMQLLAFWTMRLRPPTVVRAIHSAAFDKFLELPPPGGRVEAFCDLAELPGGAVQASLVTRAKGPSAAITRTRMHAQMVFLPGPAPEAVIPLDAAAVLKGPCIRIDSARLYETLVPFGPAYRTISPTLQVAREGAAALIQVPDLVDPQTDQPLGSPFAADAAFHAACVWSQRFAGIVAFPVGFAERRIVDPTRPGELYACRILPLSEAGGVLLFDIWILDLEGRVREVLHAVKMRDVSGGRLRPPEWIRGDALPPPGDEIPGCRAWTLIERDSLMPFAGRCLSGREERRLAGMGLKRRNAYLAGRLACKRVARTVFGLGAETPAQRIDTLSEDGLRPALSADATGPSFFCSLSHDRRFALAAAAENPIGVDVETADARALQNISLFAGPSEQARVRTSAAGMPAAAVRIWTIKEAAAKALNITLADAWRRTEVLRIGLQDSLFCLDGGSPVQAFHLDVEGHVATWVILARPCGPHRQ